MHRIITSIILLFSIPFFANAQGACGFSIANKKHIEQNPDYKMKVEKEKIDWSNYAKNKAMQRLIINGSDTVYEIPIVVHIIHTGGPIGSAFNPTDADVIAYINFVNDAYHAMWAGYPTPNSGGNDVPFNFVLAKRDINCNPTTGILRANGSGLPGYVSDGIQLDASPGADEEDVKALSKWPNDQYYNIWIVNDIGEPGVAGFAYYPGAGPNVDGTVVVANTINVGTITLVHELGHGMGLAHTFEDGEVNCPPNVDCTIDGDGICDTEPHTQNFACSATFNPCTNASINFTQHSFMSYSQGCRDRFTAGQKDRMVFNLKNNRTSLMNSIGAVAPPPTAISAVCIPTTANPSSTLNAGPQLVQLNSINKTSGGFTSEGQQVHVDYFCTDRTDLFIGAAYPISIKTGVQVENVNVYLDYNNDGQFQAPAELIFSSAGTTGNQTHTGNVTIPTTGATICTPLRLRVISDVASAPAPAACAVLQHGQAEDYVVIVKPPTGANLTIAAFAASCLDSMITFTPTLTNIPPNNIITWYVNGNVVTTGATFSINTLQNGDVVTSVTTVTNTVCNSPDSIRSNAITINHTTGDAPPVISFVNNVLISSVLPVQWYGPNGAFIPGANAQTYIPTLDGFYFARTASLPCPSIQSNVLEVGLLSSLGEYSFEHVKIYPNPAHQAITIDWGNTTAEVSIDIYNTLGQKLINTNVVNQSTKTISLNELANGIYFLTITDRDGKKGTTRIQVLR